MDTLASLALATEPPNPELLKRAPHGRNEYIITKKMFKHIFGQAIYQLAILFLLVFHGENFIPEYADNLDTFIVEKMQSGKTYTDTTRNPGQQSVPIGYDLKYSDVNSRHYVRSGRRYVLSGESLDYSFAIEYSIGPSRHFTFIFNTFVMMQLFNFLNSRKLKDEWNTFSGL